jgi:hypothetical protein
MVRMRDLGKIFFVMGLVAVESQEEKAKIIR